MQSADYSFERVRWPAETLLTFRYRLNKFDADHTLISAQGEYLANEHLRIWGGLWLTNFMLEHGDFPTPPIVLDNRDGHLVDYEYEDPDYYPKALLVVEGHTRFELGRYLYSIDRMKPDLEFYLMSRTPDPTGQP